jgi:hypothetical protein
MVGEREREREGKRRTGRSGGGDAGEEASGVGKKRREGEEAPRRRNRSGSIYLLGWIRTGSSRGWQNQRRATRRSAKQIFTKAALNHLRHKTKDRTVTTIRDDVAGVPARGAGRPCLG